MKKTLFMLTTCILIPISTFSQGIKTTFMSETRAGYSTNTYLNPFYSEWNRTFDTAYGFTSAFGQLFWDKSRHSVEANAGYVFEPFLNEQTTWHGYLTYGKYTARINSKLSAGVNAGSSSFQSDFSRKLSWVQPFLRFQPTTFTSLTFRAGANFREYSGLQDIPENNSQIRSYGIDLESWLGFKWNLKAGINGNIDNLPSFTNGLAGNLSLSRSFINGSRITSEVQIINYSSEITTDGQQGGNGGPFGPPGGANETETIDDRIWKLKLEGSYPINKNISAFIATEHLSYQSPLLENSLTDGHLSGGVRLTFSPEAGFSNNKMVNPIWNSSSDGHKIEVKYRGEGNLYLLGDFNNWERPGIPLRRESKNRYSVVLELEPGLYEYRILQKSGSEDGWLKFSDDVSTVDDGFGGKNALKIVE
ncbi:MAG: glycogen-binding domain-containing protein [Gracilimonas sp.]